ncbi:type II secretion system F family protein [Alkaliphilus sp. B6464]|uniref:type II secretion system F family protein n=1 Tax=Alkaliphilus sp. B6464 TaxID=2731219 RepID=UPI001BAA9B0F|nr:type II secretion system F family protein [Alkaliphilus sp. B6464]QUH21987.1 type II secretion system F family protein [Alkaliphilus sp. B6464]
MNFFQTIDWTSKSTLTVIFNILIVGSIIFLISNYLKQMQMKKKVSQTLVLVKSSQKKKDFIEEMIIRNKHLNKLAIDLEEKISICGFEDTTAYDIVKKSFIYAGIGTAIGIFILNPVAVLLFMIVGFVIPIIGLNDKVESQLKKMDKQILKAIQSFLNEYQKTQNIAEILEAICPKLEYPIRAEFERLLRLINSGMDLEDALYDFAKRMSNEWIYLFINALVINKENGSDITDVLMRTITKISNREIVQSEKDMEIFSGKILNRILMLTVPAAFVTVLILRPEAKDLFFHTTQGKMVINASVVLCIISFIINRVTSKM